LQVDITGFSGGPGQGLLDGETQVHGHDLGRFDLARFNGMHIQEFLDPPPILVPRARMAPTCLATWGVCGDSASMSQ